MTMSQFRYIDVQNSYIPHSSYLIPLLTHTLLLQSTPQLYAFSYLEDFTGTFIIYFRPFIIYRLIILTSKHKKTTNGNNQNTVRKKYTEIS